LLVSLTARDVKLRYKQTALGVIWVVLQPLVAAGIFSVIFGKLADLGSDKTKDGKFIPLFLFTFAGLVAWNVFFGIITKVSGILVQNSSLVSKVYFPRVLLPCAGAMGVIVDLLVVIVMLGRVYVGAHNPLDVTAGLGVGLLVGSVLDLVLR
jgi:lipopolysaccharide transport system permease protein